MFKVIFGRKNPKHCVKNKLSENKKKFDFLNTLNHFIDSLFLRNDDISKEKTNKRIISTINYLFERTLKLSIP